MKYSEPIAEYKAIKCRYFLQDSGFGPRGGGAHCAVGATVSWGWSDDSCPVGVQPPPSAWNKLDAASSLFSRTCASAFSVVSSVCWFSDTSKALRAEATASTSRRSCNVVCDNATSAFSTSEKADSTALR